MHHDPNAHMPLQSTYANDETIAEILPIFINNMPRYLTDLEVKLGAEDWPGAARVCHDLKGTAGGYGYPDIGRAVQQLEAEIKGEKDSAKIAALLATVKSLCARARLGVDPTLPH
jgi:HPt (histidine-containing phosphotransfer) domain-containing protein